MGYIKLIFHISYFIMSRNLNNFYKLYYIIDYSQPINPKRLQILINTSVFMYAIIDGIEFVAFLGAVIYAITARRWEVGVPSGIMFLIYPVFNELVYNGLAKIFSVKSRLTPSSKSRLVYHPNYNLSFCGLQKLHPFDSQKYGNVVAKLQQYGVISQKQLVKPGRISRSFLLEKVSMSYLLKLCYSIPLCIYIEIPLFFIPNFLLRWRVLNPMLLATEGTLIACQLAERMKWAINLSGGYHHASTQTGGGFCVYPDITLAVHYIRSRMQKQRVMIIDLDAHQGNGYQKDLGGDDKVFIVDCYNHNIYPGDRVAKVAIKLDIAVSHHTSDFDYLTSLKQISSAIQNFKPQFIIYNAGTDTLVGDPLGNLNLTEQCHVKRDQFIVGQAIKRNIPVIMLLSGGYQKTNADVIAQSIKNLMIQFRQNN